MRIYKVVICFLMGLFLFGACASQPTHDAKENSSQARSRPYVLLVSIDGFRHDYIQKYHPPHLEEIQKTSAHAVEMIPSFPSKTYPNHFAMITGMYPIHNGIVANEFMDPTTREVYSSKDRPLLNQSKWYAGTPLWSLCGQQGMVSASYFWFGSEVPLAAGQPTYWYPYQDSTPNSERVQQIIKWLKLPESERPHLLTLYFSDVDTSGHQFGPDADETKDAVMKVDTAIGELQEGLKTIGLPVNLIVVSDHGMSATPKDKSEKLPDAANLDDFDLLGRGPLILFYLKPGRDKNLILETQRKLEARAMHYRVYRPEQLPAEFHYSGGALANRAGDLIMVADWPYSVGFSDDLQKLRGGNHGWDPNDGSEMHSMFMAVGPQIRGSQELPAFENVNIYPLVAKILGLKLPEGLDGRPEVLQNIYLGESK